MPLLMPSKNIEGDTRLAVRQSRTEQTRGARHSRSELNIHFFV